MTELKPYAFQQVAVDKFCLEDEFGYSKIRNVLLGDDMGLGKTVTGIEVDKRRRLHKLSDKEVAWLRGKKRTLIVTLKSMLGTWQDHLRDWNPSLKVCVIDTKNRGQFVAAVLRGDYDVYICHWETLRLEPDLKNVPWLHVIADEVHKIKNRKAQITQGLKKLSVLYKTAMSGTWVDNRPHDAWSILNWLYHRTWSGYNQFFNYHIMHRYHDTSGYCQAKSDTEGLCGKSHKTSFKEITGVHDVELLHRQMGPFYVRRTKEEVLQDLPDKYYTEVEVDLDPKQRKTYDSMRRRMLAWVGAHEDQPCAAPIVITQLLRLQQFATAYGQIIWKPVKLETGEIVQKDFLLLDEPSTKLDALMERLETATGENPQVVFSHSKQVIYMLKARLDKVGLGCVLLTGDQSQRHRDAAVRDFQAGKYPVFAGTVGAGGEGITLTKSSTIHLLSRHPSPSKNRQTIDRLHRIGQKNAVHVIDYIARDTIDKERLDKIEWKWSILKEMLGDK